uniref:Uncharacterized protein n=1 Tax=Panagrolaimus davidi TaxID=227884 RepID=A0A914Q2F6_9BILA
MSSESELKTALSDSNISSKDVDTAREISESSAKISSSCNTAGLNHELESMVSAAQTFLLPVGTLQADVQRSVTEVHNLQQQLAQTPHTFDARASVSAQNLGDAPTQNLSSVENELKTAVVMSTTDISSLPQQPCDTPTKDVQTACEVTESTRSNYSVEGEVKTAVENSSKRTPCDTPTKDVETAREATETASTFLLPVGTLQADVQRSVTEVHNLQQQLAQTPHTFDARASLSAQNLGDAPTQNLSSVENELKTAVVMSTTDISSLPQQPCDTPTKDVQTACEVTESTRSNYSVEGEVKTAVENSSKGTPCDTPTKDVETARQVTEPSTGDITSLSRYHSFENLVPEIHPRFDDEDDNFAPTPEQLLAKDRQKRDPSSYYYIPSLNKGPVDRAPRLRQVSSQYAVHELSNYAMDEPNQAYKLKTQTLPKPTSTLRNEEGLRLRCVPSEYVLDSQPHHGVMWRK